MHRCTSHNCKRRDWRDRATPWWAMKIPSLADPGAYLHTRQDDRRGRRERNSLLVKFHEGERPCTSQRARVSNYFSFVCEETFCGAVARCSFPLIFHHFPSILILSSVGEKIDLPIMGNRYERERRTTQGVVCTSAATSQTSARINRNAHSRLHGEPHKERERERGWDEWCGSGADVRVCAGGRRRTSSRTVYICHEASRDKGWCCRWVQVNLWPPDEILFPQQRLV